MQGIRRGAEKFDRLQAIAEARHLQLVPKFVQGS
jgi:hypothetical protein